MREENYDEEKRVIWWPEPEPNGVEAQGIQKDKNFCLPYCLPHKTIKNGIRGSRGRVHKLRHRNELASRTVLTEASKLDLSSDRGNITRCF